MGPEKKYLAARVPGHLYDGLFAKSKLKGVTLTDVLIEALEKYLGKDIPGLCPNCGLQNDPDAKFCSGCGIPLSESEDTLKGYIDRTVDERVKLIMARNQALEENPELIELLPNQVRKSLRKKKDL